MENTFEIVHRDAFLNDWSLLNQSIVRATTGAAAHLWKGPILALRKKGISYDPNNYENITLEDFRDVIDYFLAYGNETITEEDQTRNTKIKGVRVNCEGDQKISGAKRFVAAQVPRYHPIFATNNTPCGISRLGLPVLVRKYPANKAWLKNDSISSSGYINQAATFLHLNTDPNSQAMLGWGWAPMEWQNKVGSVLVVRLDGEELLPQQREALCMFCQVKMQPFEDSMGADMDPEHPMSKNAVLQQMTKSSFDAILQSTGQVELRRIQVGWQQSHPI